MDAARLRELLAPYLAAPADDLLVARVLGHLELLLRWNERTNLTAVRAEDEMVRRHFGESLFAAAQLLARDSHATVIDVGSGAGFPGLPIKYWAPQAQVTLVEGHGKKATFLREVGRALKLDGLTVPGVRAEAITERAESVTLRAVERFEHVLPVAKALVAPGGTLGLLIGAAQQERALELLGPGKASAAAIPGSDSRIVLSWRAAQ